MLIGITTHLVNPVSLTDVNRLYNLHVVNVKGHIVLNYANYHTALVAVVSLSAILELGYSASVLVVLEDLLLDWLHPMLFRTYLSYCLWKGGEEGGSTMRMQLVGGD